MHVEPASPAVFTAVDDLWTDPSVSFAGECPQIPASEGYGAKSIIILAYGHQAGKKRFLIKTFTLKKTGKFAKKVSAGWFSAETFVSFAQPGRSFFHASGRTPFPFSERGFSSVAF